MDGRVHKRIIGYSFQRQSKLHNRVLAYADRYTVLKRHVVYVRHALDPESFFAELDQFYCEQIHQYPELLDREFQVVLNTGGKVHATRSKLPYSPVARVHEDIRFFRISIPFGEIAIEFGQKHLTMNELGYARNGELSKALESPLIGCDMTRSEILVEFLARVHWAAQLLPRSVLEDIIGEIIADAVPA